jgi:acetylglutamate kinase
MRVTDEETMEVVEWVLAGEVQQDIVGLINAAGGKAVGLTGRDGGLIRARKLKMLDKDDPTKEHDVGQVGEIESIDPSVVKACRTTQFIPVISPIGFGADNESYNINADLVAAKLAEVLKAEKLVMLTNTPGVLDKAGNLLTDLTAAPRSTSCSPTAPSAAACCPRWPARWTPPRAASTRCTSSTGGCRMRCCWRS